MQYITQEELIQIELNRINEKIDRVDNPKKWARIDKEREEWDIIWDKISLSDKFRHEFENKINKLIPDNVTLRE